VAKGIQFLHGGIMPGLFGNNLKITNILLDQNLVAKIGSYNRNGQVRGTASDWCRLSQPWQRKIRR
jgi:hypothetical protein